MDLTSDQRGRHGRDADADDVVLDADGVIRWIDVHPNYTTRTEASEILAALDEIRP